MADLRSKTAAKRWKWTPEILSLLLNLSDRPAENSRLGDLDTLEHLRPRDEPQLTWEDIARSEEGYDDTIWDDVHDRAASSSSDEDHDLVLSEESRSEGTESTGNSLAEEHDERSFLQSIIVKPDHSKLRNLQEAQAWRTHPSSRITTLTELEVVRESLHALRNLPSPIFSQHPQHPSRLAPNPKYQIDGISSSACLSILSRIGQTSSRMSELRLFAAQHTVRPLLQTFYSRVTKTLSDFDKHLATIENRFVDLMTPVVVSLLSVETEISELASLPLRMWEIVSKLEDGERLYDRPYTLLDELHDQVCTAQAIGDTDMYSQMADVFFECLATYLKPMLQWMETGKLMKGTLGNDGESSNEEDEGNDDDFPIEIREGHIQLATFWRDRFVLKWGGDEEVLAPKFLRFAIDKVFSCGKTVAFMRELGIAPDSAAPNSYGGQNLSLDLILQQSPFQFFPPDGLVPFSELLHLSLDNLLTSKQQHTQQLRVHLLHTTGLLRTLQALQTLYLSANGSLFNAFADDLYTRIDRKSPTTTNRFMLEDLARSVFCAEGHRSRGLIEPNGISVSVDGVDSNQQHKLRGMGNDITLTYSIPRPLSNILSPRTTLPVYQRISAFLLRLRRASTLLTRNVLRPSAPTPGASSTATKTRTQLDIALHTLTLRLRHIMLHTVTTLQSHILCSVLHPAWLRLSHQLDDDTGKTQTVDDMIELHEGFVRLIRGAALFDYSHDADDGGGAGREQKKGDASTTIQRCFDAVFRGCDDFSAVTISEEGGNGEKGHQKAKRLRQLILQHARVVAVLAGELRGMSRGGREGDGNDPGVGVGAVAGGWDAREIAEKGRRRDELRVRESWGELAEKLGPGEG